MDGRPSDPDDDDVTVVGDTELVAELRRQAAASGRAPGRPLPPPSAPVARGTTGLAQQGRDVVRSAGGVRRPAPPAPTGGETSGGYYEWYEDDEDRRSPAVWLLLAVGVAAAVIAALVLVR